MPDTDKQDRSRWYDAHRVVTALLSVIVTALLAVAAWGASGIIAQGKSIESHEERLKAHEKDIHADKEFMEKIDAKLDRLIERQK